MDRSRWLGVFVVLAWTGLAWSQPMPAPTPGGGGERYLTVQELDRPAQRCRIVRSWHQPDGTRAFQVESPGGETLTIAESGPSGPPSSGAPRALRTRIYHWGSSKTPPPGTPVPSAAAAALPLTPRPVLAQPTAPAPAGRSGFWPPAYSGQKVTPFHTMDPAGPVSTRQAPRPSAPAPGPRLTPAPAPRTVVARPAINTRDPSVPRPGRVVAQRTEPLPSPYQPAVGPATPVPRAASVSPPTRTAQATLTPPASPYNVVHPAGAPLPAHPAQAPPPSSYSVVPTPMPACASCQGNGGWHDRPLNGGEGVPGCSLACGDCPACVPGCCCPVKKPTLCERLFCRHKAPAPRRTACGELLIEVPLPPEAGSCVVCTPPPPAPARPVVAAPCPTPPPVCCCPAPAPTKPIVTAPCPAPTPVCCCPPPLAPPPKIVGPPPPCPCVKEVKPTLRERLFARRYEEKPVPVTAAGERIIEVPPSPPPPRVVAMPVVPEKPPRESLLSRLRRRPSTTASTVVPGAETLPPPQAPVVRAPTEPARPGDFRESWGKADPHQPTPIARGDLAPPPRAAAPPPLPSAVASQATPARPPVMSVPVPVDEGNAFTDPPPKRSGKPEAGQAQAPNSSNAFSDGGNNGAGGASSGQQGGAASPRPVLYSPPPSPLILDPREPHDMHNAFTLAASTRRMIPADAGATPIIPNAFSPGTNGNGFSIMPSLMPPTAAGPAQTAGQQQPTARQQPQQQVASRTAPDSRQASVSQDNSERPATLPADLDRPVAVPPEESQSDHWLVTLQESLYPSEREWAAERLGRLDWHADPRIVEALVKAAHDDPAATVRAACVRTLARMQVRSPLVLTQVRALQDDSDARVRQEVEQALGVLLTEPVRRRE